MHVFVYGTLKPGECRWSALAPFVADYVPGTMEGYAMFRSPHGTYPFIRPADGSTVEGYICSLRSGREAHVMALLDQIEGYDPADRALSLFIRTRATATNAMGAQVEAWVYLAGGRLLNGRGGCTSVEGGSWTAGGD